MTTFFCVSISLSVGLLIGFKIGVTVGYFTRDY